METANTYLLTYLLTYLHITRLQNVTSSFQSLLLPTVG